MNCKDCGCSVKNNGYLEIYGNYPKDMEPTAYVCHKCDFFNAIKEYEKDKWLNTRLITNTTMHFFHRLEYPNSNSVDYMKSKISESEMEIYYFSQKLNELAPHISEKWELIKKKIDKSPKRGFRADYAYNSVLIYTIMGRTLITIENSQNMSITFMGESDKDYKKLFFNGVQGKYQDIAETFWMIIHNWSDLEFKEDQKVGII